MASPLPLHRPLAAPATIGIALAVLAGCVPAATPPAPAPAPTPVAVALPPPPPLASDWRDWPRTPGNWSYARPGGAGIARYATADGRPLVTVSCDRPGRRLILTRPSPAAATALTVRTTSTVRSLPVQARAPADAAPLVMLDAVLGADDRLLDAMAFSRGTFTLEQAGQPPLVLPSWAEVGRVIEDCR
ncbi:hypothetical protein [Sphingomonas sp. 1P08PE]|uniref:hypothetical protein n=1 Tax=Sphingomonas sp. 1P08PE TaxID=554122 RepID=UPI0039A3076B